MKLKTIFNAVLFATFLMITQFSTNVNAQKSAYKQCTYWHFDPGMDYPKTYFLSTVSITTPCASPPNPDNGTDEIVFVGINNKGEEEYEGYTRGMKSCEITVEAIPVPGPEIGILF